MEDFQQPDEKPGVKKRPVALLIAMAVVGLALTGILGWISIKSTFSDYNYTLLMFAKTTNLNCPQMLDKLTRLDSVTAQRNLILTYYESFPTTSISDLETDTYCGEWEEGMIKILKSSHDYQVMGKAGVTLVFQLRDKDGVQACNIVIPSDKYYIPETRRSKK